MRATAFVVGVTLETPNHLTFSQMREMSVSGTFEIGSHTFNGHGGTPDAPVTASWNEEHATNDFTALEAILKAEEVPMSKVIAYPFGYAYGPLEAAAKELGYGIAFTTENGLAKAGISLLGQPRITVWPGGGDDLFLRKLDPSSWVEETEKPGS